MIHRSQNKDTGNPKRPRYLLYCYTSTWYLFVAVRMLASLAGSVSSR